MFWLNKKLKIKFELQTKWNFDYKLCVLVFFVLHLKSYDLNQYLNNPAECQGMSNQHNDKLCSDTKNESQYRSLSCNSLYIKPMLCLHLTLMNLFDFLCEYFKRILFDAPVFIFVPTNMFLDDFGPFGQFSSLGLDHLNDNTLLYINLHFEMFIKRDSWFWFSYCYHYQFDIWSERSIRFYHFWKMVLKNPILYGGSEGTYEEICLHSQSLGEALLRSMNQAANRIVLVIVFQRPKFTFFL